MKQGGIDRGSKIKLNTAQIVPDASLTFTLTEQFDWCLSHLNYEAILGLFIFLVFHLKFARTMENVQRYQTYVAKLIHLLCSELMLYAWSHLESYLKCSKHQYGKCSKHQCGKIYKKIISVEKFSKHQANKDKVRPA